MTARNAATHGLRLITSGLCTTLQDLGRPAFRHLGVPVSGAADRTSLRLANLLLGNEDNAVAVEMTLSGPHVEFTHDTVFALTGAPLNAELILASGERRPAPQSRPVAVRAGCHLVAGTATQGCRAYLAVAGGFQIPPVLGSCSTLLKSPLPDIVSRRLVAGDVIPTTVAKRSGLQAVSKVHRILEQLLSQLEERELACPRWWIRLSESSCGRRPLRFLPGPHFARLTEPSQHQLCHAAFEVRSESDRMGCRLRGPALEQSTNEQISSEAVIPGTLQLPADGQMLMLMADCAPTGGYPQIGHVIQADWSRMAQLRPGDTIHFQKTTLNEARDALVAEQWNLRRAITMAELST